MKAHFVGTSDFSLGELPPYVHAMRVLPLDLNELWAFEVDFEYSGGILLHIETRLEVQEPELQKDIMKVILEQMLMEMLILIFLRVLNSMVTNLKARTIQLLQLGRMMKQMLQVSQRALDGLQHIYQDGKLSCTQ